MIRYTWTDALRGPERGENWHPTQQPIEVMRWIVETMSKPGETILDTYMGSESTGLAALSCGRRFLGIEIEVRWFEAAKTRIGNASAQGRLF